MNKGKEVGGPTHVRKKSKGKYMPLSADERLSPSTTSTTNVALYDGQKKGEREENKKPDISG